MKRTLSSIIAAVALLSACGPGEPAPAAGSAPAAAAAAPAGTWGTVPADTVVRGTGGTGGAAGAAGAVADPGTAAGPAPGVAVPVPAAGGTALADGRPGPLPGSTPPQGGIAPAPEDGGVQQAAGDGAAILRRAAAAYQGLRSLRADFVMQLDNPLLRQRLTSRGTLYQRQPDRLALRFTDPAGDLILSDGQYFYMYQPSSNPDQYFRQPAAAAAGAGVNLYAQFVGNPVERFSYSLEGTERVGGRTAHVMTLVPRQPAEYRSLKVWLDERDGLARRFEITEHNGTVRRFDLHNMQLNVAVPDTVFRFTPPPGARAIAPG
jgi:outer membrane lipoprotein-sorting protein